MPLLEVIRGDIREPGSLRFRNKPAAPCILEYSTDAGSSWRDGFDFDLCLAGMRRQLTNIWEVTVGPTIEALYQTTVNEYTTNNDMSVFAPQMVFNGNPIQDGWRDAALCQAVRDMVKYSAEIALADRNGIATISSVTSAATGFIGALMGAGIILTTAGTGTAFALALATAGFGAGGSIFSTVSTSVLTDETIREAVACCLYCTIKGQTPSKATFQTGLSGCDFPFGSGEAQLAGAIFGLLARDDVFATFVRAAQDNIRAAQLGLIECPCECAEDEWDIVFDFRDGWNGFSPVPGGDGLAQGTYVAGQGIAPGPSNFNGVQTLNIGKAWGIAVNPTEIVLEVATTAPQNWVYIYLHTAEPSYEINGAELPTTVTDGLRSIQWTGSVQRNSTDRFAIAVLPWTAFAFHLRRILIKTGGGA